MLIRSPSLETLGLPSKDWSSEEVVRGQVAELKHNTWLKNLQEFSEAVGVTSLTLHSVQKSSAPTSPAELPVDSALLFFEVLGLVADCSQVSATLHLSFVQQMHVDGKALPVKTLITQVPSLLSSLGYYLTKLEALLASSRVLDMEGQGWHMQHSYAAMRIWQGSMATYRGKCLQRLLAEWTTTLSNATTISGAALPAWDACFSKTCL